MCLKFGGFAGGWVGEWVVGWVGDQSKMSFWWLERGTPQMTQNDTVCGCV